MKVDLKDPKTQKVIYALGLVLLIALLILAFLLGRVTVAPTAALLAGRLRGRVVAGGVQRRRAGLDALLVRRARPAGPRGRPERSPARRQASSFTSSAMGRPYGTMLVMKRAAALLAVCGLVVSAGVVVQSATAKLPACAELAATGANLSEGPPSARNALGNVNPLGTLRAAVLFVDYSDAPASASPSDIVAGMQPGLDWLQVASYGRLTISLQPATGWLRMPKSAASYQLTRASPNKGHRVLIGDAIAAADPTFDFSQTDIVYVVSPQSKLIDYSPASRNFPGTWVADGRKLAAAVTWGLGLYKYGRTGVPHETGHLLGLPDLYALDASSGDIHRFVGSWDLMGDHIRGTDLFAWHRLKLGWLDPAQLVCAPKGRTTTVKLRPVETSSGTKAIFARTGPGTGVLIENRQPIGNDSSICDRGALVYKVDSSIASGSGPIKVIGGTTAGCGAGKRSDAPIHVGQRGTVDGVRISVIATDGANVTVRVTMPE